MTESASTLQQQHQSLTPVEQLPPPYEQIQNSVGANNLEFKPYSVTLQRHDYSILIPFCDLLMQWFARVKEGRTLLSSLHS